MAKLNFRKIVCATLMVLLVPSFTACGQTAKGNETGNVSGTESRKAGQPSNAEKASIVMKNGVIQTMTSEKDTAQAIAISGTKIVYVGNNDGVQAYIGDNTKVIDLNGKMVTPGFMDGHIHAPGTWLTSMYDIDLTGMTTNKEYLSAIKKFIDAHPDLKKYFGTPFMQNAYKLPDGSNPGPQKTDLDKICSTKPIVIYDISGHAVWVNSKALEMAGITKNTKDPTGGRINRDKNGEPSGFLSDNAVNLLGDVGIPSYTDDMYRAAAKAFEKEANSMGITGITNILMCDASIYKKMEDAGELTLRMRTAYTITPGTSIKDALSVMAKQKKNNGDLITTGTAKIFADGVTESGTALMLKPYLKAADRGDNWYGESVWKNIDEFNKMVIALDAAKYQIHIHAIGDGAVHQALNAFELAQKANGKRDARFTLTHVCAITNEDIKRDADLGVVNALQFLWMYHDSLCDLERAYIGDERAMAMYPIKDEIAAGCKVSGASDNPVTGYNPFEEMQVAVTRNSPNPKERDTNMYRNPSQAITRYQALQAYTTNVAYQNFWDTKLGTITVGKTADLAVLNQNILTCNVKNIADTKVEYTLLNGKIVYQKQ